METLCAGLLLLHRPPPVTLGSGRTSLVDKFAACLHALYLETGSASTLHSCCSGVISITTDLGVEFGLMDLSASFSDVSPWAPREDAAESIALDDMIDDLPGESEGWDLSFRGSLAIPGLLHILHNAANGVLCVAQELSSAVDSMAEVAKLVRLRRSCDRLCESCFGSEVGQHHQASLRTFSGSVYRGRWGTIAFCIRSLLDIRHILQWGWNRDAYLASGTEKHGSFQGNHIEVEVADAAIQSDYFWECLQTLDNVMCCVRACMLWAESCPCHYHLMVKDSLSDEMRSAFSSCPLRGRRKPEISGGDLPTAHGGAQAGLAHGT